MNQDPTKNKTKEIFFENLDFDFSLFLTSLLKPLRFNGSIDFSAEIQKKNKISGANLSFCRKSLEKNQFDSNLAFACSMLGTNKNIIPNGGFSW